MTKAETRRCRATDQAKAPKTDVLTDTSKKTRGKRRRKPKATSTYAPTDSTEMAGTGVAATGTPSVEADDNTSNPKKKVRRVVKVKRKPKPTEGVPDAP